MLNDRSVKRLQSYHKYSYTHLLWCLFRNRMFCGIPHFVCPGFEATPINLVKTCQKTVFRTWEIILTIKKRLQLRHSQLRLMCVSYYAFLLFHRACRKCRNSHRRKWNHLLVSSLLVNCRRRWTVHELWKAGT